MSMNKSKALEIFEAAKIYCEDHYADELIWAKSISSQSFANLKSKQFLAEYCWVVFASGFKVSTIEAIFPQLKEAYKNFDLEPLSRMRSIRPVLEIFNNERKAKAFLEGSKSIAREGFSNFKKRLRKEGIDMLEELPGIGPITKLHLAKNIGFVDEAKPDVWIVREADLCSSTPKELVEFLGEMYGLSNHVVDVILWRYGADKKLKM